MSALTLAGVGLLASLSTAAAPDEILVDLQDDVTPADVLELEGLFRGLDLELNSIHSRDEQLYVAQVHPTRQAEVIERLRRDGRVEFAEPNHIYTLIEDPALAERGTVGGTRGPAPRPDLETHRDPFRPTPLPVNDPLWERQWSFTLIGTPLAWRTSQGEGVVVAVIDTGVAFEDRNQFRRVEDLDGDRFVPGYDFIKDTDHPNDDHGHGTHVAGTIAQSTNNGLGVAGVAPRARIMPLKVLSRQGRGTAGDIADAIRFAADEGAQVINLSLGGGPRSFVMESAVRHARKKGVVVVCAAGNGGRARVEYPAAYPGAFAVSSVGPDKKLAFYSSYGKQIALAAPGGNKQFGEAGGILQNTITPSSVGETNNYLSYQGTSMAAPHVAGVAALVIGAGVRDVEQVEKVLVETAQDLGPSGWDERYGHGMLNAAAAVQKADTLSRAMGLAGGMGAVPGHGQAAFHHPAPHAVPYEHGRAGGECPYLSKSDTPPAGPQGNPLIWSLFPMLLAVAGLLHVRFMRPVLMVLAGVWGVALLVAAFIDGMDVAWIPSAGGLFDQSWLVLNAIGLMWLVMRLAHLTYHPTASEVRAREQA